VLWRGTILFGNLGAKLVIAAVLVSTFGCLNGLISARRLCYAMARDGYSCRLCNCTRHGHARHGAGCIKPSYRSRLRSRSYSGLLTYTMFASFCSPD